MGRLAAAAAMTILCGCANAKSIEPVAAPLRDLDAAEIEARVAHVRQDPLGYLREVAKKCSTLEQYTVTFIRQERRGFGLLQRLYEPERIACWFRRSPFSIRMKWLDEDVKYGESTYVAGQDDDRVRFVPRNGLFGLPPGVVRIRPATSVTWGESRYPVTDFGLERLMQRVFKSIEEEGGHVTVSYEGLTCLNGSDRPLHFVRLEYPPWHKPAPLLELYLDVQTDWPVCSRILFANGELDGAYVYQDLNPRVKLTDEHFLLDAERAQAAAAQPTYPQAGSAR